MPQPLLGTDLVVQVGILVKDIRKTCEEYAAFLGCGIPPVITTDEETRARTRYLGSPTPARAQLAFFHVGPQLDIELIQPDGEPSTWREDLDRMGEGFHHIAFQVKGMQEKNALLEAHGMPLVQCGEYTGGRYAYHDASGPLKLLIELLEND